jgi:hypothetical protein
MILQHILVNRAKITSPKKEDDMGKLHPLDLSAILTTIIGVSALTANEVVLGQLTAIFGSHTQQVLAVVGLAGLIAPVLLRVYGAPSATVVETPAAPSTEISK